MLLWRLNRNYFFKYSLSLGLCLTDYLLVILRAVVNPVALRKAKIVYSFGLSECRRVKTIQTLIRFSSQEQSDQVIYWFFSISFAIY